VAKSEGGVYVSREREKIPQRLESEAFRWLKANAENIQSFGKSLIALGQLLQK
jgi:hypothetical protein